MKKFKLLFLLLPLLFSGYVNAEEKITPSEFEIPALRMKLSNDGTGIINNVSCSGCDYKFVKITKNTKAYLNGDKVDVLRARERLGKPVFIQFVRESGEVVAIYWNDRNSQ